MESEDEVNETEGAIASRPENVVQEPAMSPSNVQRDNNCLEYNSKLTSVFQSFGAGERGGWRRSRHGISGWEWRLFHSSGSVPKKFGIARQLGTDHVSQF